MTTRNFFQSSVPLAIGLVLLAGVFSCRSESDEKAQEKLIDKTYPYEGFFLDKQWSDELFDFNTYELAFRQAKMGIEDGKRSVGTWKVEGPGNIGARINTIAIDPNDKNRMFCGFSDGGVWRTTDGGANWEPVFDNQTRLAIGHIYFHPTIPNTIYVGTGDPNIGGYVKIGDGLYESTDGGDTWRYIGLRDQRIISKLAIHPSSPNTIYAATMGVPFQKNNRRGLYKSENRGATWQQILYLNDSTGVIDLIQDPVNPEILFACTWNRIRSDKRSLVSGPDAGIYKSFDGGATWKKLTEGLPDGPMSRIGIIQAPSNRNVLYATYTHPQNFNLQGIYKSTDLGESWTRVPTEDQNLPATVFGGFGWYFGKIRVNPKDENDVFILGVDLFRKKGEEPWVMAAPPWFTYDVHADKHDLVFTDTHMYLATDGGMYRSDYENTAWEDVENIPTTQFYRVATNPFQPDQYYGGAQDNGSTGGNAAMINDWPRIFGGDGFQMRFHPTKSNVFYVETQNGNIAVTRDGGNTFLGGSNGLEGPRYWDMPYFLSPHNPSVMYTGTDRVYTSTAGDVPEWFPISELVVDPTSDAFVKSVTTIDESILQEGLLYTGGGDGSVWTSPDAGQTWSSISAGLPVRYVSCIKASPTEKDWVYVSHTGYRANEFTAQLFLSKNQGATWESISGDLPAFSINSILILPNTQDQVIFVGTDGGVYYTKDGGSSWERVGTNMPLIPVYDLALTEDKRGIIAGTYARGIQSFDLDQIGLISNATVELTPTKKFTLFPTIGQDIFYIQAQEAPSRGVEFFIFDQVGKMVYNGALRIQKAEIRLGNLQPGMYFLKIQNETHRFQVIQ